MKLRMVNGWVKKFAEGAHIVFRLRQIFALSAIFCTSAHWI
jgi:hypothetical protein